MEQWSARDGAATTKASAQEVGQFPRRRGSPVTASSIFQLAYSSDGEPCRHALDWNDDISAGTNHTDGQLVDPRCGSPRSRPAGTVGLWTSSGATCRPCLKRTSMWPMSPRVSWPTTNAARPRAAGPAPPGSSLPNWAPAAGISQVLGDWDPEVGAWICFNPVDGTGRKDANVTAYRYALVEWR